MVMHDFLHHVRLFELLPVGLYEWEDEPDCDPPMDWVRLDALASDVGKFQAQNSVLERQRFDTLITQQWLRVTLWKLAFEPKAASKDGSSSLPPWNLPMEVGKVVMKALSTASPQIVDCHGKTIVSCLPEHTNSSLTHCKEQKLFGIGMSLVQSCPSPSSGNSLPTVGPRDMLQTIVASLSRIRGCESSLLPELLNSSRHLLDISDPYARISSPDLDGAYLPHDISEFFAIEQELMGMDNTTQVSFQPAVEESECTIFDDESWRDVLDV